MDQPTERIAKVERSRYGVRAGGVRQVGRLVGEPTESEETAYIETVARRAVNRRRAARRPEEPYPAALRGAVRVRGAEPVSSVCAPAPRALRSPV